jgi:anti-anti-sigma factor
MIQLSEETKAGWCVVAVRGRADADSADELETALRSAVDQHARVAADLSGLDYVSSAGLRALIQAARAAEVRGANFAICSPTPSVKRVFDMSGLHQILNIHGVLPC